MKVRSRRILVIAGCSGEGRPTPKPDGSEIKHFGEFACPVRSIKRLSLPYDMTKI
jgi:hypothetical protein